MATHESEETTVSDSGMITIPADIRRRLDIGAGDKLRWDVDESGRLTVEVVHQREGVFDDFEPVDAGETNAVEAEREFGSE
ncbi:AbrB/MazE/SpoVT family DNA-binding domain-containing protein [Halomarina oriensis]|uniref:AbrB/MazE/SpoVT family DNA-binding domain-containing protein n=1 Tax=Halomarina oriensis TaxID=671145 RepID=A0A6B0GHR9_9EURY|nr:AbrB/MazE/SpoVT family DNA-binding domain-containing protein [Halomarina oriensis]MWG32969.1 AbrB/MazE/SpoVT family DNA-binding domain-containing protein [Halomarina oriensis]